MALSPFPLSTLGEPFTLADKSLDIAFRFGSEKGTKLRARGDLRHSMTNLACVVLTPGTLAAWDRLAGISRLLNKDDRDWRFVKADHEAAYKQLPLRAEQSKLAVVALRCPTDGRWYGFVSRTMMFGAVSAVLHYNLFSKLPTEIVAKLFGIPLICFFGDFGAMLPSELVAEGLLTFTLFCSKLGITLKKEKYELGATATFVGLSGFLPCRQNGWMLEVSLPLEKAEAWAGEIAQHTHAGCIAAVPIEKLIGDLGFPQTNLFGKFPRTQIRPLYRKLRTRRYVPTLSSAELRLFVWRSSILRSLPIAFREG